jgi:hypothetical protein
VLCSIYKLSGNPGEDAAGASRSRKQCIGVLDRTTPSVDHGAIVGI